MKLYPEMFLSPWHLIVLLFVLIAWVGLMIGRYDRKTILRSTGLTALVFYFIVTIPVGLITQDSLYKQETMLAELDQSFAEQKEKSSLMSVQDHIMVYVGAYKNDDGADILVYAGNYHSSETFTGNIKVSVYDKDKEDVFAKTYEHVTLAPGEKKELDTTYTSQPMDTYYIQYEAQP
ncbi:hypothetical protein [Paenibacillus sp. FSL K6-1566]|uniref:hypothetical protein n=1 Tax=unclassified Paenibacillus TaxID=185978 RepID=UPI00310148CC